MDWGRFLPGACGVLAVGLGLCLDFIHSWHLMPPFKFILSSSRMDSWAAPSVGLHGTGMLLTIQCALEGHICGWGGHLNN